MADLYIPGVPIDPGNWHGEQVCRPQVTAHRSYGNWPGDYSVIKNGGLAHLLIGREYGQWVQFAPANIRQYHDAVNVGYGVEVTGTNEEEMTPWAIAAVRYCLMHLTFMIGVPLRYDDGSLEGWVDVHYWNGVHSHNMIIPSSGYQHTNLWLWSDWDKIINAPPAPPPDPPWIPPVEWFESRKKGENVDIINWAGQLNVVSVDGTGRMSYDAHTSQGYGNWGARDWTVATGLMPNSPVMLDILHDGNLHIFAKKSDGKRFHTWRRLDTGQFAGGETLP